MKVKIRAQVVASLLPGFIDVLAGYGYGHLDGGVMHKVSRDLFPEDCRMPNKLIWVTIENSGVIDVERMSAEEEQLNRL